LKVEARTKAEEEAASYQKFEYWCKNSLKELNTAIAKGKEDIETLEDEIEAKQKLIAQMESEIAVLQEQLDASAVAAKEAKEIREDEEKAYTDADKDYDDTIKAIGECIDALEGAKKDTSLLADKTVQKVIKIAEYLVSDQERAMLTSFLQQAPEKPAPKTYTFKSQKVIELLKDLLEKFETEKLEATKAETNSNNAYNLAKEARDQADEAATKSKEEKEKIKEGAEGDLADYEEDLATAKEELKANEETLGATTDTCSIKAEEYATRKETMANEIEAMDVAIKILAKVGGVRDPADKKEGLIQKQPVSFIQIDDPSDPKGRAVKILVAEAQKLHSKSLRKLADRLRKIGDGPFDEIIQMIQKMIFRLMAEQKDEDDHKNWCDMELEKSTESQKDKSEKKSALEDDIADAEAKVQDLTMKIAELEKEAADITAEIKQATELRTEEKAENEATIKDAKDAQEAITNAIAVLNDFYASAGFLQKGHRAPVSLPDEPSTWESGYTGVADPNAQPDGIVTVLEKVLADFADMESQTAGQEATDQEQYDKDMTEMTVTKAEKEKEAEMKTHEKKRLVDKLEGFNTQLKHVSAELEAVEQYLKDLEPACVSGDSTYEDRKKARSDEIDALRKAQVILEEAFKEKKEEFLQRKVSAHLQ